MSLIFKYHARDAKGNNRDGEIEALNENDAVKKLQEQGLVVISIEMVEALKEITADKPSEAQSKTTNNGNKKFNRTIVAGVFLSIVIVLIGGLYIHSSIRETYNKQTDEIIKKWNDACNLASSTSRIALSGPVSQLQDIKREAEKIKVSGRVKNCHQHLLSHMDLTIEGFLLFMRQEEATTELYFENSREELLKWKECSNPRRYEQEILKEKEINESQAKARVMTIATALETYAVVSNGYYPSDESALTDAKPPYINDSYNNKTIQGYNYSLALDSKGYKIIAKPSNCGTTGNKIFEVKTGGIEYEEKCH